MILTNAKGIPFEKPEPLAKDASIDASIDEQIADMRRVHAYNDAVADSANTSFDRAFRKRGNNA
jgi:hypothetical protein